METSAYGLRVRTSLPYVEALSATTAALKEQGFGIITTIDMKETLKAKIDRDFRKYTILGACNPTMASRALDAELEVGLLLPCNVVVYEAEGGGSVVSAMAPVAALGVVPDNPALSEVAHEVEGRLRKALSSLDAGH